MRRTAVRAFPVGTIALLLLLAASPASACNCPSLGALGPGAKAVAGPGDEVHYSLSNLSDGAEYSIQVSKREVVSTQVYHGTSPVSGTFVMPDLGGSDGGVTVNAVISHPDLVVDTCTTKPNTTIMYTVPKAPSSGTPGVGAPQADRQAAPERSRPAKSPPRVHQRAPNRPKHAAPEPDPIAPRASPRAPVNPAVEPTGSRGHPGHHAIAASVAQSPAPAAKPAPASRVVSTEPHTSPALMGLRRADAQPSPTAQPVVLVERATSTHFPWELSALGLLVFAAISGGGWGFARARRRGPPPEPDADLRPLPACEGDPDALEAELQELIAEERARDMSRETAAIRIGPG
jgi:hypothetical protein